MTTRNPTVTRGEDGSWKKFSWGGASALANGDDGAPIAFAEWADRSVQVLGTFGTGGTVVWEGSNDGGSTWFTLTDPQGSTISKQTAGGVAVTEATHLARPRVSAGDGTTLLEVHVLCRRANPMRT